jgi:opacity protein-like surface antigen
MHKMSFLVFLLLTITIIAQAQVSIVPKAGVNFASISEHSVFSNRQTLTGFTAGIGLNYSLSGNNFLSVQPELLYTQKGFSGQTNIINVLNFDSDYRLNYLELPLMVNVGFGSEAFTFHLNAGPSIGYLLDGRIKGRGNLLGIGFLGRNYNEKINFTDNPSLTRINDVDANRVEFSVNFGGGFGFNFGENSTIFVDARYNLGLTEFDRNQNAKNRVIALTAGVRLPL